MVPEGTVGLVDVHARFVTGSHARRAEKAGRAAPDGVPTRPSWPASAHLEAVDRCGADTAMPSAASRGARVGDGASARHPACGTDDAGPALPRRLPAPPDPAGPGRPPHGGGPARPPAAGAETRVAGIGAAPAPGDGGRRSLTAAGTRCVPPLLTHDSRKAG